MKSKLEYIWLDGITPTQSLRSKTRVERDFGGTLQECPMWNFDGSSTAQAEGNASDLLLKPAAIFPTHPVGRLPRYDGGSDADRHTTSPTVAHDSRTTTRTSGSDSSRSILWDTSTNLRRVPAALSGSRSYYCSARRATPLRPGS